MRYLIICGMLSIGGCAHTSAVSALIPSAKLANAPATCMAGPVIPPVIKAGDDIAVDDAKVHSILGTEEDKERCLQSYIRRLHGNQGA